MTAKEVLAAYERTGGVLKGHFLLTSGRHSDTYMQSAKLFVHPDEAEKIVAALAEKLAPYKPDIVVSRRWAASFSDMSSRASSASPTFSPSAKTGNMTLRRGFELNKGARRRGRRRRGHDGRQRQGSHRPLPQPRRRRRRVRERGRPLQRKSGVPGAVRAPSFHGSHELGTGRMPPVQGGRAAPYKPGSRK